MVKEWLHFADGHEISIYQRSKIELPSSHYGLVYQIKEGYVEFSFSVPKALYGNNIAQFVTAPGAMNIGVEKHTMSFQADSTYKRMLNMLKRFLSEVGQGAKFDWTEVEILSLDVCYNQFFDSEKDAKCYIDWQKKIWKPRVRRQGNMMRTFDTSISYVTDGYTCKIYHKGEEYRKHDAKRHQSINDECKEALLKKSKANGIRLTKSELSRAKKFDIEALQKTANRIVRYEVHYRKSELSRMAMTKEFRKTDTQHKLRDDLYRRIRAATREGTRRVEEFRFSWADYNNKTYPKKLRKHMDNMIHKRGITLKEGMRYASKKSNQPSVPVGIFHCTKKEIILAVEYVNGKEWKFYHEYLNAIRKRRSIYVETQPGDKLWFSGGNDCGSMKEIIPIKLDKALFAHVHRHFLNFMKSFQVKKMPDFEESMLRIEAYNDEMKKERDYAKSVGNSVTKFQGVNKNSMAAVLKLADKHEWNEIPEILGLCPRTWRRYKAKLKLVGRTEVNVGYGDMLKSISLDFKKYYEEADRLGKKLYVTENAYFHD